MSKKRSIISLVLVLFLMLQVCGVFPVYAVDSGENIDEYVYSIPTELISEENIDEYGHMARVFAAEGDMNEICILNEDGSNSVYIFDYPVKYVDDSDGKIKDKSNKLYNSNRNNYLYVNEDNDVRTVFPKKIIKHPVITTIGDYEISIGIITDSKYPKKGELVGDNYVLYNEAFGENTAIGYKAEFDGYKEEIIIYSENSPKTYSFEIVCEGLVLNNVNGTLTFVDEASGDVVFTSDPLYIYDSSVQENGYIDTMYEIKKVDDYEYVMTIELNEAFLQTEGLTYPIYIDPSIKYNNRDYIHDAPIYTARADEACGNHLVSYVGKYEDAYGVGRLLVRFPEMRESGSVFRSLDADEVISVKMYLYNSARGSYTATIKAYQFLGTIGWDESTVTWNNAGANSLGDLQASVGISSTSSGYYAFDITDAAKLWVGNLRTADYRSQEGIIFLNANESDINYARSFRMSNFGASYTPYIVVNYSNTIDDGTYFVQNVGTSRYMDVEASSTAEGANIQQWDYHTGNHAKWNIVKQSDGYYTIQSVHSGKYVGVENSSINSGAAIKQYTSNAGDGTRWGFSFSASGNYIITSKVVGLNNRVLSVPLDANINGTDLVQYTYSDNDNYRDEWVLVNESVNIEFRYDYGYITRNKIGSETTATTRNRISNNIVAEYFPNIRNAFAQRCHLNMFLTQTIIPVYTSDADLCDESDINAHCACIDNTACLLEFHHNPYDNNSINGYDYGVHCKSMTRIRNNLISGLPANTIRVAYTGHVACFYSTTNGHVTNVVGLSDYTYPIISMREPQSDRKSSILVLAHELTHSYGIQHHNVVPGTTCIMDSARYVYNDPDDYTTYWCPNCISTIKENAGKY